ncbi:CHRD domain-containing protein [Cohnella luojiensis]|uniref:CHRD domain-containing protein n=1 Tax=Cohnella luojiensis TaxID=652876 RepID=A0A4Y8M591_9BACL|nr:CHRD domain-containing protein [Cohnella luojiensis]TFE30089.1 CHRD domain-containing protein [Cohnella luojiensis]
MADFIAILRGRFEVPPVATDATGTTLFRLSGDGRRLHFSLKVNNIRNATQAHIHLGFPGQNGPIVAFLFGAGRSGNTGGSDFLVEGTLTREDLIGPLEWGTIADLVREILRGNTYVNVHTVQNPDGEIRGQIVPTLGTMSTRKSKAVKKGSSKRKT